MTSLWNLLWFVPLLALALACAVSLLVVVGMVVIYAADQWLLRREQRRAKVQRAQVRHPSMRSHVTHVSGPRRCTNVNGLSSNVRYLPPGEWIS